jgi:ATP adenylyltransferase
MDYLYAPWRGTYATQLTDKKKQPHAQHESIFTVQFADGKSDQEHLILTRLAHVIILLNLYPYNPGHILVVPVRKVARLDELTRTERAELMEAIAASAALLEKILGNPGTNVGFNLGDWSSGGSIPDHLHAHVIPRWRGDTGFLPLLAQVKPLSEDLREVYEKLREPFKQLEILSQNNT